MNQANKVELMPTEFHVAGQEKSRLLRGKRTSKPQVYFYPTHPPVPLRTNEDGSITFVTRVTPFRATLPSPAQIMRAASGAKSEMAGLRLQYDLMRVFLPINKGTLWSMRNSISQNKLRKALEGNHES